MDWSVIKARLQSIGDSFDQASTISAERTRSILESRAARLAELATTSEPARAADMLLVFRVGAERYGLPLAEVVEVLRDPKLAAVPGGPAAVAGLLQVRGEVLPVLSARQLLGARGDAAEDAYRVVIVTRTRNRRTGLLVSEVEEIRDAGPVREAPSRAGSAALFITADLVTVLNVNRIHDED